MFIALRIEVRTLPGALTGVPNLLRLLDTYGVQATFLFALGPDRSAWSHWPLSHQPLTEERRTAPLHAPDPGRRLRGLLPPAPLMGPRVLEVMRACRDAGHELGCLAPDTVDWERRAAHADADWTNARIKQALADFEALMGTSPALFAAPGWQVNPHLIAAESRLGLPYASDTRGHNPFLPLLLGIHGSCPQVPVTLPTLSELIGRDGVTADKLHEYVFAESQYLAPQGHCFGASAEIEGQAMLGVMERLLTMWRGVWGRTGPMRDLLADLDPQRLPTHQVGWGEAPGRTGHIAMQGRQVAIE